MLSDEEKQKLEQEFQYALDNIVSKIKGEIPTAIVYSEQPMILLFKKLMFKIEKQSKEIEELKKPKYIIDFETNEIKKLTNDFVSKAKIKAFIKEELPDDEICSCCEIFDINGIDLKRKLQSLLEDNTEEIEEANLWHVTGESDFNNMTIVKLLNELFEKNNGIDLKRKLQSLLEKEE